MPVPPRVEHGYDISGTTAQRPSSGDIGCRFFDTTLGVWLVWNGSIWQPAAGIVAVERSFTEDGAGTYTASVVLPAGATLIDIILNGVALWAAATSALMKVGDAADDDGYFTAVNLKATDLLAGESINFALAGGKAGAYIANSQVSPRYSATARTISGVATSVGAGTTGRTRMTVVYALSTAIEATKA